MLSAVMAKQFEFCFQDFPNNQEPHFLTSSFISHLGRKKSRALPALTEAAAAVLPAAQCPS